MTREQFLQILRPGDHLLYSGKGIWSRLIKVKTWSRFSHIEIYIGNGKAISARSEGVNYFNFDEKNLTCILRPESFIDIQKANAWFESVRGQKYDYWGLLRFFTLGKQSLDKQFCSEVCLRYDRTGGFFPFSGMIDADLVSPGMNYCSPHFKAPLYDVKG